MAESPYAPIHPPQVHRLALPQAQKTNGLFQRLAAVAYGYGSAAYWARTYARYRTAHELDPSFTFAGENIRIRGDGLLVGGPAGYISAGSLVHVPAGLTIRFGRGVAIGENVRIDAISSIANHDRSQGPKVKQADITISDFAWIGMGAYIGPGVTIGRNAVVGANVVVTRDVPENAIVRVAIDVRGLGEQ